MARQKSTVEVIPSARRLIQSLRDVGYDFKHAVADLIDNSVAASASTVAIEMRFNGRESWVRVADDGVGMNGRTITEAMRFGTERDYEAEELGKFGLGLKTASLSQCSRLTVASRIDSSARRIEVRQWDMAHVQATNRWEIIDVPSDERPDQLIEPLQDGTGTVVLWELMDRVLGYKIPWGDRARVGFLRLAEELDLHLGMVFHRFLTGEARRKKKLRITINSTAVEPWDPFVQHEKATLALPGKQFEINGDEGPGLVLYTPYILPPQDKFSSLKAFDRSAGPGKWNYQQGFYIYRADRMIQSGGWSYMRTSDEHTKLARVALDFWPDLDSAFDLNVAKARVNLPADLRAKLQPEVEQLVKQARHVYSTRSGNSDQQGAGHSRETLQPSSAPALIGVHGTSQLVPEYDASNNVIDAETQPRMSKSHADIGQALEHAARTAGESRALNIIRRVLKSENPEAAAEIGW
ncbi:MAG: ATP-binding protein [Betaproteobacteria bacterium]|nr:ATP-binding protein [Betaproteobacteria bacterium]